MNPELAKSTVRHYFHQLLNARDISVCEELLAPAYIDHDAPVGTPAGPNATKEFVAAFLDNIQI